VGLRLTYNLYKKGDYQPDKEDYRWQTIRTFYNGRPFQWELYQLFVNNIYLMISNWVLTVLPLFIIYQGPKKLKIYDYPLIALFLLFLFLESMADYQMLVYQTEKKRTCEKT